MIANFKLKRLNKHLEKKMNFYESECKKWESKDVDKYLESENKLEVLVEIMDLMDWDLK